MTTLFRAPQIGEPRATGVKNGGVTSYDTRIIQPVSRITGNAFEAGKQLSFRWRSSSSAFHNPRETKLAVRYKLRFGPEVDAAGVAAGQQDGLDGDELPPNVRFTACPNSCLFADGAQYQVNSTMIENQPAYYDAAMVNLYTKFDEASDTSGSNGLVSRRKDLHHYSYNDRALAAGVVREGFQELSEMHNAKQDVIRQGFPADASTSGEIELLEPVWLSSWQHGYFVAGADHELTFTIGQNFAQDLFYSAETDFKELEKAAGPPAVYTPTVETFAAYENVVCGELPADGTLSAKTVYVEITSVELHCAFAGTVPSIPPSVSLKYSELQITNRPIRQETIEESIVVPPSTRAIYICSRQNVHDIRADREELTLAGAGIDEVGLIAGAAGNTATLPHIFKSLNLELGGQVVPGNGGYTNMDVTQLRSGRPFTDALSVVGKPSAMRGTTWDFLDWSGKKSVNGRTFPAAATGTLGAYPMANQVFGDQGPMYMMRMILPPNSLSNVLTLRATMSGQPQDGAKQLLTIICVHDQLWNMQYAPPAELPISTTKAPIT
eukprot:COSAG06_NODE_1488_length_9290_cov_4.140899_11_plen_551_part_00